MCQQQQVTTDALAAVRSVEDLRVMFRDRIASLAITFDTADAIAGLTKGYTAKLLGPVPIRRFGPLAIDCLLGATGIKLLAVEDAEAMARIKNLEPRRKAPSLQRASQVRFSKTLDTDFMRKIGALGGVKTAQTRRARASAKRAVSDMKRRAAFRRWHPGA